MRLASLAYTALRYTGVTIMSRWVRDRGVVLCYHNVVDQLDGAAATLGLHMPLPTFESQVRWLVRRYTILPLDEFVTRAARGASLRRIAAITFDDGYAGVFTHAWPVLKDLRIPATVFLVAGAHEQGPDHGFWWDDADVLRMYSPQTEARWLTDDKGDGATIVAAGRRAPPWGRPATWSTVVAAAQEGLGIGAHTYTHRTLPTLSDGDLYRELIESRHLIRRRTGVDPVLFAYPYGLWNERIRRAVHAAGYRAAFTLGGAARTRGRDPWTLPRLSVPAGISSAAFQAWTAGLTPPAGWRRP